MRFTAKAQLPVSELITDYRSVLETCEYFSRTQGPIGFDTETSGLEHDGLGAELQVVCLADERRRLAVLVSGDHAQNLVPMARMLRETQHRHAGFNIQYDWNVCYGDTRWRRRWQEPLHLKQCYADGMKLFCLFDEEGEDTDGDRGLKARARQWIGLPMAKYDKVVESGGILDALRENRDLAIEYMTRDAWAHLGVVLKGREITKLYPWCARCPVCGEYCFERDSDHAHWLCPVHGRVKPGPDQMTTIWDWHRELDVPYLHVLQMLQLRGMPVDWEYLRNAVAPLTQARDAALAEFHAEVNAALSARRKSESRLLASGDLGVRINPASTADLMRFYHGDVDTSGAVVGVNLPVIARTKSGAPQVGEKQLQKLMVLYNAPGIRPLLQYRKLEKILKTYIVGLETRKFEPTGRLHGAFRAVTTTGRLASRDPNMQNFPTRDIKATLPPLAAYIPTVAELVTQLGLSEEEARAELAKDAYKPRTTTVNIRDAIRAPAGFSLICADYSQLEIRLTALESQCADLTRVLLEGTDMHCYAAARAFAAAIPGLAYADIYEAKQWGEGDANPRWLALRRLAKSSPDDGRDFATLRTLKAGAEQALYLDACREWQMSVGDVADDASLGDGEWLRFMADIDAGLVPWDGCDLRDLQKQVVKVLGLRDKELINLRKAAKSAIFGIIYGIGPTKLAAQIAEATNQPCTLEEAKYLIQSIKDVIFPGIGRMVERQKRTLREYGYVRTRMGRYRHPAHVHSGDSGRRAKAERQSTNSPIQGLAADVVQRAMLAIENDAEISTRGAYMFCQVHDEILMLCPLEHVDFVLPRMKHHMETAHGLITAVPLEVSARAAATWNEAK